MRFIYFQGFFFVLSCLFVNSIVHAQVTRGAIPGEIYIATDWYSDNSGQIHYAILRSDDNGENIELLYQCSTDDPPGEMSIGKVLGDASFGVIYNHGDNEIWVSQDFGNNWEMVDGPFSMSYYFTGFMEGEIYKSWINEGLWQVELFKSEDFGTTFNLINESIEVGSLEIGNLPEEVYGLNGSPGVGFNLNRSTDSGLSFFETPIDSIVAFWSVSGNYPVISRGSEVGELYLLSWWPDYHYKLFHSIDTGNTWLEQFESDYIDLFFWRVSFTGGRELGSIYVMRSRINPEGDHVWMYIDYSTDFGQTFNTYFHDLDSTITGTSDSYFDGLHVRSFPNPFRTWTTFFLQLPSDMIGFDLHLNIYNSLGVLIRRIEILESSNIIWDGNDYRGVEAPKGLYLYNISFNNEKSKIKKLIKN